MIYLFLGYPNCSTSRSAEKWLKENSINYEYRNIVEENPSEKELKEWIKQSNLPLKRFFNTSGLLYKSLQLKDKLPNMSEEEQIKLLATDGKLVKRPILLKDNKFALIGFKQDEWEKILT